MKRPLGLTLGAIALACTMATPAHAQLRTPEQDQAAAAQHSPVGRWRFATTELPSRCTMSGQMTVREARDGVHACTLIVFQTCAVGVIEKIRTDQLCTLESRDGRLHIESRIDKIVSVEPADIMEMVKAGYAPDNFVVGMNALGDTMSGIFISLAQAPVTFVRIEELVS